MWALWAFRTIDSICPEVLAIRMAIVPIFSQIVAIFPPIPLVVGQVLAIVSQILAIHPNVPSILLELVRTRAGLEVLPESLSVLAEVAPIFTNILLIRANIPAVFLQIPSVLSVIPAILPQILPVLCDIPGWRRGLRERGAPDKRYGQDHHATDYPMTSEHDSLLVLCIDLPFLRSPEGYSSRYNTQINEHGPYPLTTESNS